MAELLKGAPVSRAIFAALQPAVLALEQQGIRPQLVAVECGEREDNRAYLRGMQKNCEKLGLLFRHVTLPQTVETEQLAAEIQALNADTAVHGILVLQPLPKTVDEAVLQQIAPQKDVDGITETSRLRLLGGSEGFLPCTAEACMALLEHYGISAAGKRAAVVGRSAVIGMPVSLMLTAADATVTICHSKTKDIAAVCREADIVVAAAGKPRLLGADCFSPSATVLDVGIHVLPDGSMCGDVDSDAAGAVSACTPVPGGVGSVTSAVLMRHVVQAAGGAV